MTTIVELRTQAPVQTGPLRLPKESRMAHVESVDPSSRRALETAQFRLIFIVSFVAFLLEAIALRAMPWRDHQDASALDRKKSVFAQARAATDRTIPFAFMN
jgi:hypothetical protein